MPDLTLAPWVLKKSNYLLGPRLTLIRLPENFKNLSATLSSSQYKILQEKNFTWWGGHPFFDSNVEEYEDKDEDAYNFIWLSASHLFNDAYLLKESLEKIDGQRWRIIRRKDQIYRRENSKNPNKRIYLIYFSDKENINLKSNLKLLEGLLQKNVRILWFGETIEGLCIGPIIDSVESLRDYLRATLEWVSAQTLINHGFKNYWPLSIRYHLYKNREKLARTILETIEFSGNYAYLLEEERKVCLWTQLTKNKIPEHELRAYQVWSKGFIKNLAIISPKEISPIFLSKCHSPCKNTYYLEVNSGKGISYQKAFISLIGEAVERFSSWQANMMSRAHNEKHYELRDFHPFGAEWESYQEKGEPSIPSLYVRDLTQGNISIAVPACLVPFPYERGIAEQRATSSFTAGLAVYNNQAGAILRGALELVERNNFYPAFMNKLPGYRLLLSQPSKGVGGLPNKLLALIKDLAKNEIEVWPIIYKDSFNLPIVHCFLLDKSFNFFSRGSGSAGTLLKAWLMALLEAIQVLLQLRSKYSSRKLEELEDWCSKEITREILDYLESFESLHLSINSYFMQEPNEDELLLKVQKNLKQAGYHLLIADLPCPISEWYAIRALIPGFTLHQYPSQSEGGKKIINAQFKVIIPN